MTKRAEIDYLQSIGEAGRRAAINKPFSDENCGRFLASLGQIMNLLPVPPARLLDLGCGTGWTSLMLAKRGYQVVGVDIAPDMIECANESKAQERIENLEFEVADFEAIRESDSFDAALFFDSLHHADDEYLALKSVYSALKQGGICVVSEPGYGHTKSESAQHAINKFGVNEKDMPPTKIVRLSRKIGFSTAVVFPHPNHVLSVSYHNPGSNASKLVRLAEQSGIPASLRATVLSIFLKWRNGLVVLEK